MPLTTQQRAFIDAVMRVRKHLCLRARAGTGLAYVATTRSQRDLIYVN
jgi:hypothetical protein